MNYVQTFCTRFTTVWKYFVECFIFTEREKSLINAFFRGERTQIHYIRITHLYTDRQDDTSTNKELPVPK